jgi:hypothetical protein
MTLNLPEEDVFEAIDGLIVASERGDDAVPVVWLSEIAEKLKVAIEAQGYKATKHPEGYGYLWEKR